MDKQQFESKRQAVSTPSGRISYVEHGPADGPVALFVHGVLLNAYLWRYQLAGLADVRRCIALDLPAHGQTTTPADQDLSSAANARAIVQFLDALQLNQVDLIGNDSGGGIAQIVAARHPERIRSLTLTDCDTHDNWPPEAFKPFLKMAAEGGLRGALEAMLGNKAIYRSPEALGPAYQDAARVSDETIETCLRPHLSSPARLQALERFLAAFDNADTLAIESRLKELRAPTLIVWGSDDIYFDAKWARWLERTIPGTRRRVELKDARLFFPEERPEELNQELRSHFAASAPR